MILEQSNMVNFVKIKKDGNAGKQKLRWRRRISLKEMVRQERMEAQEKYWKGGGYGTE